MSRLRGYCLTCNGPLWRAPWATTKMGCRLCWLAIPCADDHLLPHDHRAYGVATDLRHETRGEWRRADVDANSTANTAATSDWSPRVWVGDGLRGVRRSHDIAVAWFRHTATTRLSVADEIPLRKEKVME